MRLRKQILAVLLTAAMAVTSITVPGQTTKVASAADNSTFEDLNQSQMTAAMGAGWNLGNQLEAAVGGTPGETNWGNPVINEELILSVKDAGFTSVRIPVSYLSMIGSDSNYTIDSSWLDRVQEVVDMCIDNDLYAIINMHGDGYTTIDGGWLLCGSSDQTAIKAKYKACWKQIATRFKDYDEHLVFESMNEEFDGTYGNPSATAYANINAYNQIFVDTVRQTGGNNDKRWLLLPGWNTNINYTADDYGFVIPTDNYLSSSIASGEKRIMISVHYYDPWGFCGTEDGAVTQWGDTVTDGSKVDSWGDESYLKSQFKKMHDKFVANGYPVVIGEYGSIDKSTSDSNNTACRAEFARKVCYYADMYGLIPVYWDNGYNGQYGFGLFDRYTYKVTQQTIIDAIMEIYGGSASATATGIKLDKTSLTIAVGDEKQTINATLTPADSTDKITWKSSNEDVATVNSKGQVTAVSAGTCTITASVPLGYSATCEVTVPKPSTLRAKLYLLETANWQSVISEEYAEITSDGGDYSLSLTATESQLKNIGSLYIRDISVGDEEASAFDYAKIKVSSIEVNGKTYSMKNDTFVYDTSLEKGSDDGLSNNIFNFSFVNVWANTHVNDVTVESGNYKAYFNNASYTTSNSLKINFSVSEIDGSVATSAPATATPEPTAEATATPVVTAEPTVEPTATPVVTVVPTATPEPTVEATATPEATVAPTATAGTSGTTLLFSGDANQNYETSDPAWLMNAADSDVVELKYTCTDSSHAYWGIMGWGASVNGSWVNGKSYTASSNPSDEITATCTVAELKESLGITAGTSVSYLCLSVYNGGKVISLSVSGKDAEATATPEATVEPTATPKVTVAPTVEPTATPVVTVAPTVEPTATPVVTVAPTVEPTATPVVTVAPTVEPTATPEATVAPTDSPSEDGSNTEAKLEVTADWGAGGLGSITVTNTTGQDFTSGWAVSFTLDRSIVSCWSGTLESFGNNDYKITCPAWNQTLRAGESVTLNFQLGSGSSNPTLSNVVLSNN